jgi:hypothetical protein
LRAAPIPVVWRLKCGALSMPSKRDELKQRLAAVLADLKDEAPKDPEAIWLIGSLASDLALKAKAPTWKAFKQKMTQDMYRTLVRDFQAEGNKLYQENKRRHAYAIQALAISIVASTQRVDPQMREGEALLDGFIEKALTVYRTTQKPA